MKKLTLWLFAMSVASAAWTQERAQDFHMIALDHLQSQAPAWQLSADDLREMRITDQYTSSHNGVTHVYFIQQYRGIDIDGATYNANIKDGRVIFAGQRMQQEISSHIADRTPALTAEDAAVKALAHLDVAIRSPLTVKRQVDAHAVVFDKGSQALQDIPVRMIYTQHQGQLVPAWDVTIEPAPNGDLWQLKVDAVSGEVLQKILLTLYCSFPEHYLGRPHSCTEHEVFSHEATSIQTSQPSVDGSQYAVLAVPTESPRHGPLTMVSEPADPDASPFGWHVTNGMPGPEFTDTRGNNVHAFLDRDADFNPDITVDGGPDLIFDFTYDPMLEPDDYQPASVTNLFYMNNIMHDFSYHYGFDEVSGNFQAMNYTGLGVGTDPVQAHAQYGADLATPLVNNASFSTPVDGGSGRMRVYLWQGEGANRLLRVDEPQIIAGSIATGTTSNDPPWGGPPITNEPVTGEVVIVRDHTAGSATLGCNPLINGDEVNGKIALIDRGSCEFGLKALHAQNAGAIGFIICNFEEVTINMAPGAVGHEVTIPGVFITRADCEQIRVHAGNGLVVSLVNEEAGGVGPVQRDGSLDNGLIAHEYGHGISTRLTGGPSMSGCLVNYDHDNNGTFEDGEQMGEGWSDFFGLVTTVKSGDTRETPRGIATYSAGQEPTGRGIRNYPFSWDMQINPVTYDDIAFLSVPHGVGSVWCSMIWDLYWALTEEYGFDDDLYHGTGGNNLAIQLVMDGMKLQTCNPGFVDGRDAILAADVALTGGQNQRIIWETFARRGLGYSAEQGSNQFRHDNSEAFDVPRFVYQELQIAKEMTPLIAAGQDIEIELTAMNYKDSDVSGVVVTDVLPDGTTFINGSASHPHTLQGNLIAFELGALPAGEIQTITYRVSTDAGIASLRHFIDDVEGDFLWDVILDGDLILWDQQEIIVYDGEYAWGIPNVDYDVDQSIVLIDPVRVGPTGALVFYNYYDTERFFDAGIVQISTDGISWETPDVDKVIRGDYAGKIIFSLFAIPRIKAWHGHSGGWVHTVVDLSDYANQEIYVRFRFGSDDNTGGFGWFLDNIELVDLFSYNSEVCITSLEGDLACEEAPRRGTIVEGADPVSTSDPSRADDFALRVYPNPAKQYVTVDIASERVQHAVIEVVNNAGQSLWMQQVQLPAGSYRHEINTGSLPEGFYVVRVRGERDQAVQKLVVH